MEFTYQPPKQQQSQTPQQPQEFSYEPPKEQPGLGRGREYAQIGSKVAESTLGFLPGAAESLSSLVLSVPSAISQALGGPSLQPDPELIKQYKQNVPHLNTPQELHEKYTEPIAQKLGANPGELEGANSLEGITLNTIGSLPQIAASGGATFWQNLAGAIGASTGQEIAESYGAGALGQFAAAMGGGIAGKTLAKTGGNVAKFKERYIKPAEQKAYHSARTEGKNVKINPANAHGQVQNIINEISAGTPKDPHEAAALTQALDLEQFLKQVNLTFNDLWDKKKAFNKLYKNAKDPVQKEYYKRMVGILNEELQSTARNNPNVGIPFNLGENLHIGRNTQSDFRYLLEKNTKLQNIAKNTLGGAALLLLGGQKHHLGKLGLYAGAFPVRSFMRAWDLFANSSEVQKILLDIGKASVARDPIEVGNLLKQLNTLAK